MLIVFSFLVGCASGNQVDIQQQDAEPQVAPTDDTEDDQQELTFTVRTQLNVYSNEELSVALFEEIINSFSPDIWDFLVLEPNKPIQDSTFIQVGAPQADSPWPYKFDMNIGFGCAETGFRMYLFITDDQDVVLQYIIDYWQEQRIPDISLWEDISHYFN